MTDSLTQVHADIVASRKCLRLVEWREAVAADPPARYRGQEYWARPVPPFGDPDARLLILGLAPAAHGGNRTGRIFTGDRSGDWLFASLYRKGFANQPTSTHREDGLRLIDAYITAIVHCAPPGNRPLPEERDNCLPYLMRELALLRNIRVIVVLGAYALDGLARAMEMKPLPKFAHGREIEAPGGRTVICCFHPSQQNTFTGKLTDAMLDAIFDRARERISRGSGPQP
jgi:uracil-DNA glycosylase family 4